MVKYTIFVQVWNTWNPMCLPHPNLPVGKTTLMVSTTQASRPLKMLTLCSFKLGAWLPSDLESHPTRTESSITSSWKTQTLTYFIETPSHNMDNGNSLTHSDSEYSWRWLHTLNVSNNKDLLQNHATCMSGYVQAYTVHPTCCDWDDCVFKLTSQHRISCETTWWSLVNSGYWYLMGGPGPSSKATSINVAGTFSCNNRVSNSTLKFQMGNNFGIWCSSTYCSALYLLECFEKKLREQKYFPWLHSGRIITKFTKKKNTFIFLCCLLADRKTKLLKL